VVEVKIYGKPVGLILNDLYLNCVMNIVSNRNSLLHIVKFGCSFNAFNRIQNFLSTSFYGDAKSAVVICLDRVQASECIQRVCVNFCAMKRGFWRILLLGIEKTARGLQVYVSM
jgi:hypothetical protein